MTGESETEITKNKRTLKLKTETIDRQQIIYISVYINLTYIEIKLWTTCLDTKYILYCIFYNLYRYLYVNICG